MARIRIDRLQVRVPAGTDARSYGASLPEAIGRALLSQGALGQGRRHVDQLQVAAPRDAAAAAAAGAIGGAARRRP
jgi:hypothetical protein